MRSHSPSLAVVLAGGAGTRVARVLPDVVKPLAPVAGRPFLEWVLRFLRGQGIARVALSAGYRAEQIERFSQALQIAGLSVCCVRESAPLGTGGALLHTLQQLPDEPGYVLVCNGDSLALTPLQPLFTALTDRATGAALIGVRVADASRYGTLETDRDSALKGFCEKSAGSGLINAGVYLLRRTVLACFPETPLSLEYDVFPSLVQRGVPVAVVPCDCPFLDIGTESSLADADGFVRAHIRWFT